MEGRDRPPGRNLDASLRAGKPPPVRLSCTWLSDARKGRSGSLEHAGTPGLAALSAAAAGRAARPTFDERDELRSRHRGGDLEGSAAASSAAAATAACGAAAAGAAAHRDGARAGHRSRARVDEE